MKTLIVAVLAIMAALMVVPPMVHASTYYIIRDQEGNLAVTNGRPLYEWSIQSGPYSSIDEAERATGVGTGGPDAGAYYNYVLGSGEGQDYDSPEVVQRRPGQSPLVDTTP